MPYKILIVDDSRADLDCTALILSEDADLQPVATTDPTEAVSLFRADPDGFAAVLVDYQMPKDGLTLAQELLEINPSVAIAVLSADESRDVLKKCIAVGIRDFVEKSQDEEVIRSVVRWLCQRWDNRVQVFKPTEDSGSNEELISSIGLIGRSQKMAEIARLVRKISRVEANVFLHGESGVGKELVARAIHNLSSRKGRPFVGINIAAIAENLAESELFGHVRGAFTGADRSSEGKLLAANGGTLFLDEIGDLKPDLQVKLLRVLQERKVTPVGGNKATNLDVRLITATHVDLEEAIVDGRFREDLYFRIHVVPLDIPPLRDRVEDIQPLVSHFLKIHDGKDRRFLKRSVQILERYYWRGNVRELENEIQRLIALAARTIEPKHISPKIRRASGYFEGEKIPSHGELLRQLQETEFEYLQSNIRKCGSMREACRLLFKAHPSSIHTRIKILEQNLNKNNQGEVTYAE